MNEAEINETGGDSMSGPFNNRDDLHYRTRSLELAVSLYRDDLVPSDMTVMDMAEMFWKFVETGTIPEPAAGTPSDAALAFAHAIRALQEELIVAYGGQRP